MVMFMTEYEKTIFEETPGSVLSEDGVSRDADLSAGADVVADADVASDDLSDAGAALVPVSVLPPVPVAGRPAAGGDRRRAGRRVWGKAAYLILLCCLSLVFGVAGGFLADSFSDAPGAVIYQSVRTSSSTGDVSDVAAAVSDSVVEITTESVSTSVFLRQYISTGAGSGVIISPDGTIVTNTHVVDGARKIVVTLRDGSSYEAKLLGADAECDIAVIKIDVPDSVSLKAAVFGDSSGLSVGEKVVAIGNPLGKLGGTVTDGIISALERSITIDGQDMTLIQTNAAINPGNSGGGLFNMYGELVGVVNAKSSGSGIEGLGFVIPINTAKPIIHDLVAYGYVTGRTNPGVVFADLDAATASYFRLQGAGVYVYSILSGSDAAAAGLKPGDRLLAVNGMSISSADEAAALLSECRVGDKVSFTISRDRQTLVLSCVLTEYVP